VSKYVGTSLENGHLDAFVILHGTFQEIVPIGVPIARHASSDTATHPVIQGLSPRYLAVQVRPLCYNIHQCTLYGQKRC
jgi:hypothetical protein